jgi:hypothetical protein
MMLISVGLFKHHTDIVYQQYVNAILFLQKKAFTESIGPLQDSVTWYSMTKKISSDDKMIDTIRKNTLKLVMLPILSVS